MGEETQAVEGEIVFAGLATLDVIHYIEGALSQNQKIKSAFTSVDFGGPAANAAATARSLGSNAVTLCTFLGSGSETAIITSRLKAAELAVEELRPAAPQLSKAPEPNKGSLGIDGGDSSVENSAVPAYSPPIASVLVDLESGDRSVVSSFAQAPSSFRKPDLPKGTTVLMVDGHYPDAALPLLKEAQAHSALTVFDGGSWKQGTKGLLAAIDIAIVSADFRVPDDYLENPPAILEPGHFASRGGPNERARFPTMAAALLKMGPTFVAQTFGGDAIQVTDGHETVSVPVPKANVKDTLGAGDALHGAFCHYAQVELGRSAPKSGFTLETVAALLQCAAEVASKSCESIGPIRHARQAVSSSGRK